MKKRYGVRLLVVPALLLTLHAPARPLASPYRDRRTTDAYAV